MRAIPGGSAAGPIFAESSICFTWGTWMRFCSEPKSCRGSRCLSRSGRPSRNEGGRFLRSRAVRDYTVLESAAWPSRRRRVLARLTALGQALSVLLFIVTAIFAGLDACHPGRIGAVPFNRFAKAVAEVDFWFPVQFPLRFAA